MPRMFIKLRAVLALGLIALSAAPLMAAPQALVKGLTYATAFEVLPHDQFLIAEKSGKILLASANGTTHVWADLTASTDSAGDAGLLGMALDPHYAKNGYVYVSQTAQLDGKKSFRLIRMVSRQGHGVLDKVLWGGLPAAEQEPGGIVRVGPDGCLYWGVGTGGDADAAQDPKSLKGDLFRLKLDGTIPSDNPIPGSPVWSWGFRDPRGMAWNSDNGHMYGLDRGPKVVDGTMDELNLLEPDKNYGWPVIRGAEEQYGMVTSVIHCNSGHAWLPGGATFVSGGAWNDSLLFAGAGEGILYRLVFDRRYPRKIDFYQELINGELGPLTDVRQGSHHEIYILSRTGLYRLREGDDS